VARFDFDDAREVLARLADSMGLGEEE